MTVQEMIDRLEQVEDKTNVHRKVMVNKYTSARVIFTETYGS